MSLTEWDEASVGSTRNPSLLIDNDSLQPSVDGSSLLGSRSSTSILTEGNGQYVGTANQMLAQLAELDDDHHLNRRSTPTRTTVTRPSLWGTDVSTRPRNNLLLRSSSLPKILEEDEEPSKTESHDSAETREPRGSEKGSPLAQSYLTPPMMRRKRRQGKLNGPFGSYEDTIVLSNEEIERILKF